MGYAQGDINFALNDRQRRLFMWDIARADASRAGDVIVMPRGQRRRGTIGALVARAVPGTTASPIERDGEWDAALVLGGPLAKSIPGGESQTVDSRTFIDVIMSAGVARREAERMTQDVSRGGFLVAVSVRGEDVTKARNALTVFDERAVHVRERYPGATG